MTCMNCGAQLPDNAAFCNICGAKQNPVPVQPMMQPEMMAFQPMMEEDIKTVPLQPKMPTAAEAPVAAPMPVAAQQPMAEPEVPVAVQQPMAEPEAPVAVEQPMAQPEAPVAVEQPMAQPVMQEQPMQYQNPYANGQMMQSQNPYQNAPQMGGTMPYQNAQPMNNGMQYQNPYQNAQPMNGGAYPNQQAYNPYGYQNVKPAKNKKTGIIIGVILAAIIVVAVVLVLLLFKKDGHKSYKAAIDSFFESMEDHDLDGMLATFPKPLREEMRAEFTGYMTEDQLWAMYDMMLMEECGSGAKMTYRIDDVYACEPYEMVEFEDNFRMYYDYDCHITEAYEIEVEQEYRGSIGEYSEWYEFLAVEIGGKWYIIMD